MSPGEVSLLMFGVFAALIIVRIPVSFALGLACIPVLIIDARLSPIILISEMWRSYNSFILLSVPFYPILWLAHRYAIRAAFAEEKRKELIPQARETYGEITSHVLSRALLWGKRAIIVAEKESPTFLESDPYWSVGSPGFRAPEHG